MNLPLQEAHSHQFRHTFHYGAALRFDGFALLFNILCEKQGSRVRGVGGGKEGREGEREGKGRKEGRERGRERGGKEGREGERERRGGEGRERGRGMKEERVREVREGSREIDHQSSSQHSCSPYSGSMPRPTPILG